MAYNSEDYAARRLLAAMRRQGVSLPRDPGRAAREAQSMMDGISSGSLTRAVARYKKGSLGVGHSLHRVGNVQKTGGGNLQMALPMKREPLGSLREKGIPFDIHDEEELYEIRRWCNTPDAPVWMADYTFKSIGDIQVGEEVIGWETDWDKQSGRRKLVKSTVLAVQRRQAPEVVEIEFESGRKIKCTPDHNWAKKQTRKGEFEYAPAQVGNEVWHVVDPTTDNDLVDEKMIYAAGYLGAMIDGEGSCSGYEIRICQSPEVNPRICDKIEECLNILGIDYKVRDHVRTGSLSQKALRVWTLRNGINKNYQNLVNVFNWCRPAKMTSEWLDNALLRANLGSGDKVVKITSLGAGEVVSMQTTTGNYTAWGFASKNCRIFKATHYLIPLLISIYARFPIQGMEFSSKDPQIKAFYEELFFDRLN